LQCHWTLFAKDCPERGTEESQGKNNSNQSSKPNNGSKKLSAIIPEQTSVIQQGKTVEPKIEEVGATVKVLSPQPDSDNCDGSILGPTLIAKVQVEDKIVEALLDTGSLVTILSLNFIVNKLV